MNQARTSSRGRLDIRRRKVPALEQQGLTGNDCQRIGKAVIPSLSTFLPKHLAVLAESGRLDAQKTAAGGRKLGKPHAAVLTWNTSGMSTAGQTFAIRAATKDDMPAIVGIYNWAVNQTFATIDSEPLSEEEAAAWWDEHGSTVTLVAVEDDVVAGWARLLPWRQRGYHVVEDLVYVDPVYHKRGVGRQLLTSLLEEARAAGGRTVVASVAADNSSGLRLHESLGFQQVGTLKDCAYKFGRWMDITLVQRSLSE